MPYVTRVAVTKLSVYLPSVCHNSSNNACLAPTHPAYHPQSAVVTFESAELERTLQLLKTTEKALAPDTGLVNQLRTKLKAPEQLQVGQGGG